MRDLQTTGRYGSQDQSWAEQGGCLLRKQADYDCPIRCETCA